MVGYRVSLFLRFVLQNRMKILSEAGIILEVVVCGAVE